MGLFRQKLFQVRQLGLEEGYSEELEEQRSHDLVNRQIPGIVFYPVTWCLISVAVLIKESSFESLPMLLPWLLIFTLLSILRGYILRRHKRFFSTEKPCSLGLYLNVTLSAGSWGVMVGIAALKGTLLSDHLLFILTASFALCAGGVISLSISRQMTLLLIGGLMLPLIVVVMFCDSVLGVEFNILAVFYSVSMYGVSVFPKREYELMVISNLKLSRQAVKLSELTMQDGLTGINNRRYFNEAFITEISRASRLNYSLVLLMIDIDHFKQINDEHGHLVGDDCLVHTAQLLNTNIHRKTDIFARYGGEEFVLVLTNMSKEDGISYAEELRKAVGNDRFFDASTDKLLTISIGGVNLIPTKTTGAKDIIDAADKALYRAKSQGRNCVNWVEF